MVGRALRRRAAAALIIAAAATVPLHAEAIVGVKLRLLETLTRVAVEDWALFTLGTARVALAATAGNVKAELAMDALLGDGLVHSLARAWVAVRFPRYRLTAGKTRVSWGEGVAFNAADLVYGSTSAVGLDLTADALRDDAAWMAALYVPLGRFSFLEAVALPPPLDVEALLLDPAAPLPDPGDIRAGARFVGKVAGIKTEAAYLYRGTARKHTVATSLQGNLVVDWHVSASMDLPTGEAGAETAESLRLSAGLFHLQRLGPRATLSMRLETLVAPAGEWGEVEPALPPAPPPVYGLLLYPELVLAAGEALAVTARALVSPIDGSALIVPGVTLSLHKGLSFLGLATIGLGDETDSFAWNRRGGLSFILGCAYAY